MKRATDLTGQRFGRLVVQKKDETRTKYKYWVCLCDCGVTKSILEGSLKQGYTKSCGCLNAENIKKTKWKSHGGSDTKLYKVWQGMKCRCYAKNATKYKQYGGRGITVCDEWKDDYGAFQAWALANGYREGLTIDREDVNGPYSPENCRWTTNKEQQNNRRDNLMITYNGKTQTLTQWAEETGINEMALRSRIKKLGWSAERALTEPVNFQKKSQP